MVELAINALLMIVGLAMLYYGANWLIRGSVAIARKLKLSQLVIGLTIVAYGTSTPELVVSIVSAIEGRSEILLGNVVGSNIVNIGLIIGLSAIMLPLVVQRSTIRKEVPIMIGIAFLIFPLSADGKVSQLEGGILVAALMAFTYFSYKQTQKENLDASSNGQTIQSVTDSSMKAILLMVIGIILLSAGAFLTVDNAVILANALGVSERIIGLTVVAIGTSLPELFTSVVAARKGNTDISIGNIVGSNIYNIIGIVGISSTIAAVTVHPSIISDYIVMILFSLVLLPLMRSGFVISRYEGFALVSGYVIYLVIILFVQG